MNKFLQHVQSPIYTMFGDMFSFFLKTFLHNDFMFEDMFTHCSKTCGHYILIPVYTIFEEVFAKTSITKWNHDFYAWILKPRPCIFIQRHDRPSFGLIVKFVYFIVILELHYIDML